MGKKKKVNMGSVIHGTLREEDLIPAFLEELKAQRPLKREHRALVRDLERHLKTEESRSAFYSEDGWQYCLNEALPDALLDYAPPFFYFGTSEGDGSDFGWWLPSGFPQDGDFEGELTIVADLSDEILADKTLLGYVLVINERGNMTLYWRGKNGRYYEKWAVV